MKQKCLNIWLDALRSGQYSGSPGGLRTENGFCPLGVLCDVSNLSNWESEKFSNKMKYLGQINYLPKEVVDWAGMQVKEVKVVTAHLITYNDKERLSLSQIADIIERKYKHK